MTGLEPLRIVEAALFSGGKPLLEEEIVEATGLKTPEVRDALRALAKEYRERETALEVGKAGQKWAMQLRGQYSEKARKLAPMEVPIKVLKTLALIAFHQPMKQSDLKQMVGSVVYDHVKELHERGMIGWRQDGITKILTTSPRFPEYFGLDATDRDGLRRLLAERVGLDPDQLEAQRRLPTDASSGQAEAESSPESPAPEDDVPRGDEAEAAAQPLKATTS